MWLIVISVGLEALLYSTLPFYEVAKPLPYYPSRERCEAAMAEMVAQMPIDETMPMVVLKCEDMSRLHEWGDLK